MRHNARMSENAFSADAALALAARIEQQVGGTETWRVARADGSFCMEFNAREYLNPERECRKWYAERSADRPGWMEARGYQLVRSVEYTLAEQLTLEAALMLRRAADALPYAAIHPTAAEARLGQAAGIYFASKVKHAPRWRALRDSGVPTTSTWIDEAGEGQTVDYAELSVRSLREIRRASAVLLYCEPGELLKGALIEAGTALASGTRVVCVGNCESLSRTFRKHPLWTEHESVQAAVDAAQATLLGSPQIPAPAYPVP